MLKKQKRLRKRGKAPAAGRAVTRKIEHHDSDLIALMTLFGIETQEQAEYMIYIEQLAFKDWLTSLPNRALFEDRILNAIAMADRYRHGLGVMTLDLDHFKEINDTYGHMIGDEVLKAVAERLQATVRESDTVARFGGDEFVILEPIIEETSDPVDLACKLHAALQKPVTLQGVKHNVQASIGIALYPGDAETMEGLMEASDRALYVAKREGRNRFCFADEESIRADLRRELIALMSKKIRIGGIAFDPCPCRMDNGRVDNNGQNRQC